MNLCSQWVNQMSVHKKPIWVFLKWCRWFLKQLTKSTSNACWSRLFHLLISLSVKKLRLTSKVPLCLTSFSVCPLRCFIVDSSNIDSRGIADHPLAILNTSMISKYGGRMHARSDSMVGKHSRGSCEWKTPAGWRGTALAGDQGDPRS